VRHLERRGEPPQQEGRQQAAEHLRQDERGRVNRTNAGERAGEGPRKRDRSVGERAAIELPWPELQGNLRAFIARRVRDHADVDDLVQRVLLQIVTGLGSLRDAGRLHAWVYRVPQTVFVTVEPERVVNDASDRACHEGIEPARADRQFAYLCLPLISLAIPSIVARS